MNRDDMVIGGLGMLLVACVGILSSDVDWRLVYTLAIAAPIASVAVLSESGRAVRVPSEWSPTDAFASVPAWLPRWLPPLWVATALLPDLRLLGGGWRGVGAAASGQLSADNILQLAAALSVLTMLFLIVAARHRVQASPLSMAFCAFPLLVLASVTWSRIPLFTTGRAVEFLAVGSLVVLTTWAARESRELGNRIIHGVTRWFVGAVTPLTVWMFLSPRHWDGRLTWPGGHPNTTGIVLAVAVLLLAMRPDQRVFARIPVHAWVWASGLAVAQVLVQARGATIGMVAGLVALAGIRGFRNVQFGGTLLGGGLVGVGLVLTVAWQPVIDFLLRDQDQDRVLGFNGRRDLWNELLREPLGNEVWGMGMGGARGLLPADWAGNAHNAWMDLLLSLGVVGTGLVTGILLAVLTVAIVRRRASAAALVIFCAVASINTVGFHDPGAALVALALSIPLIHATDGPSSLDRQAPTRHPQSVTADATTAPAHAESSGARR